MRSPRVNVTRAQTTVSAASGQTIVIGGLITNNDRSITRSVPWLGDIPLLGELFKYDSYDTDRRELLIILTPRVVRNRSDAEHIKQLEMSRISWSSSDAFDWTSDEYSQGMSGQVDDSGVPVIYPDATPGLEWTEPIPRTMVPDYQPNLPNAPAFPTPPAVPLQQPVPSVQKAPAPRQYQLPPVTPAEYQVPFEESRKQRKLWPFSLRRNK